MRVLKKADAPISAYEVYQVVAEELIKLPIQENQLSSDELRRKFSYLAVLEHIEGNCLIPPLNNTLVTNETESKAIAYYGLGNGASLIISKDKLEQLFEILHTKYGLSQAELMQISDLVPRQLVDFYAIIEKCGARFDESQVSSMLEETQRVIGSTDDNFEISEDKET